MIKSKFKIGDKVRYKGHGGNYCFNGDSIPAKKGDVFTISAVRGDIYSVEGAYVTRPNWCSMEKHFELLESAVTSFEF